MAFTSSPTSSPLSTLSTNRVINTGLGLKQLSTSPEEIFEMVKGMEMMKTGGNAESMDMAIMAEDGKEMLVKLRLFYLGAVYSTKDMMEVENETPGREILERGGRYFITSSSLKINFNAKLQIKRYLLGEDI